VRCVCRAVLPLSAAVLVVVMMVGRLCGYFGSSRGYVDFCYEGVFGMHWMLCVYDDGDRVGSFVGSMMMVMWVFGGASLRGFGRG